MRHFEKTLVVPASPEEIFTFVDDHRNFSSHMNKSSWIMAGSRLETKIDEGHGQKIGSHIKMDGTILGIKLFLDEVITKYEPPIRKEWQTVGELNLLVIGHYKLGLEIASDKNYSILKIYIDYNLPKGFATKLLGLVFADFYAKWCVHQMLQDTAHNFQAQTGIAPNNKSKIYLNGILASTVLLSIYFITVSLVSGWDQLIYQFSSFWYFIVTLALLFGIQVSLYTYLKNLMKNKSSPHILTVSGSTSTAAMISCCAHYLVNFVPLLGTVGIITLISQYQIQLFWVGLMFSFGGLLYMLFQINKLSKVS